MKQGHFIAISFDPVSYTCLLFDSLALEANFAFVDPNISNVLEYLKQEHTTLKCIQMKRAIQSLTSSMCGFHCVAFVLSRDSRLKQNFQKFLSAYNTEEKKLKTNDLISVNYILQFIEQFGVNKISK